MNTVADGLASLSFHQGERKKRKKKRERDSGNRKEVKGKRQYSMSAKYTFLKKVLLSIHQSSISSAEKIKHFSARVSLIECLFIAVCERDISGRIVAQKINTKRKSY